MGHYPLRQFVYPVLDFDVYDCDTVKIVSDLGHGLTFNLSVRIMGIDAPELRTRNKLEKAAGYLCTAVTCQWMATLPRCQFHSIKRDKYAGRGIGDFFDLDKPSDTLSQYLLQLKVVEPYLGGKKKKWSNRRLKDIQKRCKNILGI